MKINKNRPRQTIAVFFIVMGLLAMALGGYLSPIANAVLSPVFGAQNWITTRFQSFQDFINAPTDLVRLRQEKAQAEAEIAALQSQVIALQQQVTEIEILEALLDFARTQPQNKYQAATVIFRDTRPFQKYVVINVGSDKGIRAGMPVVNAQGLVGRVDAVIANAARVQLITDPISAVSISIQPEDVDAVLVGSITGNLTLDLVPQEASIEPGNLILTSGLGGLYPPNILVGQVASVRSSATALFQQAAVQPVADFSRIEIVLVIVNFQPVDITPLLPEEITLP